MPEQLRELISRCLGGDQTAMVDLVRRFEGQIFGLCYRMLSHRQDAEDAAQETFVRALRHLHQWDANRDFEPWLLAIAGNRCRSQLAKRGRQPRSLPLQEDCPAKAADFQAAQQLAEEIKVGLETLREEYRQAFYLFHEQELSYAEIAEALDCPVGTVKTWVHRARKELVDRLRRRGMLEEKGHAVRRR